MAARRIPAMPASPVCGEVFADCFAVVVASVAVVVASDVVVETGSVVVVVVSAGRSSGSISTI